MTLNCRNARNVNFDSYVDLVRETRACNVVTNPHRIARHKTHGIITRSEKKIHRMVYDKRVRIN